MAKFLQLTLWNANSLTQHIGEQKTFISIHNIDVMLMNHPAGTTIIMKKFHQASPTKQL
jgi:hypothetical protein